MAHFNPPVISENPSGWGPCTVPDQFKDMPYQPFSKGDRLGKVKSFNNLTNRVMNSIHLPSGNREKLSLDGWAYPVNGNLP